MNLTPLHFLAHRTEELACSMYFSRFSAKKKFPPFSSSLNEFAFMQIKQPQPVLRQYCSSTHNSSPARDKPTDLVKSHKSPQVVTCMIGSALVASQLAKMLK